MAQRSGFMAMAVLCAAMAGLLACAPALAWEDAVVMAPNVGKAEGEPDYILQAGVFASEAEARSLSEELDGRGLEPYIFASADADGDFRYAVRLGIHETLYQAMFAADDLNGQYGLDVAITEDGSFTPIDFTRQVFLVQVVALSKADNLSEVIREYENKGYASGAVSLDDGGEEWYIVYIGAYDTFAQADGVAEEFRGAEARPCYVLMMDRDLYSQRRMGG